MRKFRGKERLAILLEIHRCDRSEYEIRLEDLKSFQILLFKEFEVFEAEILKIWISVMDE